jgi:hypothetical protein
MNLILTFNLNSLVNQGIIKSIFIDDIKTTGAADKRFNCFEKNRFLQPLLLNQRKSSSLSFRGNYEDTYHLHKESENTNIYHYGLDLNGHIKLKDNEGTVGFELADTRIKTESLQPGTDFTVLYYLTKQRNSVSYARNINPRLDLGVGLGYDPQKSHLPMDYSFEASYKPTDFSGINLQISNIHLHQGLALSYEDASFSAEGVSSRRRYQLEIPLGIHKDWQLSISQGYEELNSLPFKQERDYTFTEQGTAYDTQLSVSFQLNPDINLLLVANQKNSREQGYLQYIGGEFSSLKTIFKKEQITIGTQKKINKNTLFADWTICFTDLNIIGKVESWPFADITADIINLIGTRTYFTTKGTLANNTIHLGLEHTYEKNIDLLIGLKYIPLRPKGNMVSWEPYLAGFGRKNVKESEVLIEEVKFLNPNLGIGYTHNNWKISYSFTQFIPVEIREKEIPTPPTEPLPKEVKQGGGSFHFLSLTYRFSTS